MNETTVAVLALLVLGWAIVSRLLANHDVTGPLAFVVAGYLLGNPDFGPVTVDVTSSSLHAVASITLALVLFHDASCIDARALRHDLALPARLLGVALPLTVVLGGLLAGWLVTDLPWALAAFVGAALAPTDAALSTQVIEDERIPTRLRRGLNVESGLNDGIATPLVTFALAIAASQLGLTGATEAHQAGGALRELGVGLAVGIAMGAVAASAMSSAGRRAWTAPGGRRIGTLATAVAAFALASAVDGNGFLAAFAAGLAFGRTLGDTLVRVDDVGALTELTSRLLGLVIWFLFGATLVPIAVDVADVPITLYAVASLTVVRMLPVVASMVHSGLERPDVLFVGWFGPRGLATVVFALLAVEGLGTQAPVVQRSVATVALTVALSVLLHGVTAGPGVRRLVQARGPAMDARARDTSPSDIIPG